MGSGRRSLGAEHETMLRLMSGSRGKPYAVPCVNGLNLLSSELRPPHTLPPLRGQVHIRTAPPLDTRLFPSPTSMAR